MKRIGAIRERIYAKGTWVSSTALHVGGEADGNDFTDMVLLRDRKGRFLIPGASIAGAARAYLLEGLLGRQAFVNEKTSRMVEILFGGQYASLMTIPDAELLEPPVAPLVRDGVAVESSSGMAQDEAKFNFEVLPAGSRFGFEFQIVLPSDKELPDYWEGREKNAMKGKAQKATIKEIEGCLRTILEAFASGEIRLGARKRRGLGCGNVSDWKLYRLRMGDAVQVAAWLGRKPEDAVQGANVESLQSLSAFTPRVDLGLHVQLQCRLAGSLLLRSPGPFANGPDSVHLTELGKCQLPGTAIAGALRARARRITDTLAPGYNPSTEDGPTDGPTVCKLFGPVKKTREQLQKEKQSGKKKEKLFAGNLFTKDAELPGGLDHLLVQGRVAIDRFTAGALEAHLFEEAAYWPKKGDPPFSIELCLVEPDPAQAALLLLLVKDLSTEDLPVCGESGAGRGFLRAVSGEVKWLGKPLLEIGKNGPQPPDAESMGILKGFHAALVESLHERSAVHAG